jgi:myo-inositol-1(or 4)-monophosphatase
MDPLDAAVAAARLAGQFIAAQFRQPQDAREKGPQDFVTAVDVEAERIIVDRLSEAFPHHVFQGEEGHKPNGASSHLWVIDPLDGTRNFLLGIPFFCVSIALVVDGRIEAGVIFDPLHKELYSATAGMGTFLNGHRLTLAAPAVLEGATIYAGFLPAKNQLNPGLSLPIFERLYPSVAAMRNMGSAALSLAYVACGRLDAAYHDRLSSWDMLAGALLVQEAGGSCTDLTGQPITVQSTDIAVAASRGMHAALLEVIHEVVAERRFGRRGRSGAHPHASHQGGRPDREEEWR